MKIKIMFSDRLTPEECDALLDNDTIKGFLMKIPCGFCCRLYETDFKKDGFHAFINDSAKPCVFIKSFTKEDGKWYGGVDVPEPYKKYIPLIKTGYIHLGIYCKENETLFLLGNMIKYTTSSFELE
jgi:hypothetical protein